jgi:hypothetical protein
MHIRSRDSIGRCARPADALVAVRARIKRSAAVYSRFERGIRAGRPVEWERLIWH